MGVQFYYKRNGPRSSVPNWVEMANRHASSLWEFALQVASEYTGGKANPAEVERLRDWYRADYPGRDVDVECVFPDASSRVFWGRVFFDVAAKIVRRELGNQETHCWQSAAIHRAFSVALLLINAARDLGQIRPEDWQMTIDEEDEARWRAEQAAQYEARRVKPSAEPPAP